MAIWDSAAAPLRSNVGRLLPKETLIGEFASSSIQYIWPLPMRLVLGRFPLDQGLDTCGRFARMRLNSAIFPSLTQKRHFVCKLVVIAPMTQSQVTWPSRYTIGRGGFGVVRPKEVPSSPG